MDYIYLLTLMLSVTDCTVSTQRVKQQTTESTAADVLCPQENGTCVPVTTCPYVLNLLNILKRDTEKKTIILRIIQSMQCGFDDQSTPLVCCPKAPSNSAIVYKTDEPATRRPRPPTTPLPLEDSKVTEAMSLAVPEASETARPSFDLFPGRNICGQVVGSDKIIGGMVAEVDEFPWMARIKYKDLDERAPFSYLCAASLITDRHLLTAAHCMSTKKKPVSVRLGEWNTESPMECFEGRCPDPPIEVEIENVVLYDKWDKTNYTVGDIAVLVLKQSVNFTDFIQPICLPTTEYVKMQDYSHEGTYVTSGWGFTEFGSVSVVKRKVNVAPVPMDVCRVAVSYIPESSSNALICAGGRQGKDSCRGDSGGPLMKEVSENYGMNWYLYGITSFGPQLCGKEGIPGAYTRVTVYMDWIRNVVNKTEHFVHR